MPCEPSWAARRALVVFGGQADLIWLNMLKHGYRHCFAVIESGRGVWVIYNPLSHCTEIATVAGPDGPALAGHYRKLGFRVVETRINRPPKCPAPWRFYTCVEAVKRLLGLRAGGVFTPWQLYKYLQLSNKSLTKGFLS